MRKIQLSSLYGKFKPVRKALLMQEGSKRSVLFLVEKKTPTSHFEGIGKVIIIDNDYLKALAIQGYILF